MSEIKVIEKELAELYKKSNPLEKRLRELKEQNRKLENEKLLGRTYKYHNTQDGKDFWWLYVEIVDIDEDNDLIVDEYQLRFGERPEIIRKTLGDLSWTGYEPCSRKEFKDGIDKILKALGLIKKPE